MRDPLSLSRTSARVPYARPIGWHHGESGYTAPQLRTVPARVGALRALGHPSRTGDRLKWPDGTVTDLRGVPAPISTPTTLE